VEELGNLEVQHLHGAGVGHEDVVGLEIAVDDVMRVRDGERAHHGHHELDGLRRWELPTVLHELRERRALEELEHHERAAAVLADLVNDDDVLVAAPRGRPGLDDEARGELGVVAAQELDRGLAAELGVARGVDRAHAAATELADDLVLSDPRTGLGQRRCVL
jgi:hypothetical protein